MGDLAIASLAGEKEKVNQLLLYKLFGIQAEYLIDHAWGYEPCRISDIHAMTAERKSISSGQVLPFPYDAKKGRVVAEEMASSLSFELAEKALDTELISLSLSFDGENIGESYRGEKRINHYGRFVPRGVHGIRHLKKRGNGETEIIEAVLSIYDEIMDSCLSLRKISLSAEDVHPVEERKTGQIDLFTYLSEKDGGMKKTEPCSMEKRDKAREASLLVMHKYGKNAMLKAYQYMEGARGRERNRQIGGHSSGI